MFICIDFDGTIVDHRYPDIGQPVPGALECMKDLIAAGARLILFTMRSDEQLAQAVEYLDSNGVMLFGVNTNPQQKTWTQSPKAYGQIYIDDAAFGCPKISVPGFARPCVDWTEVRKHLLEG